MDSLMNFSDPFTWLFYITVMIGMAMAIFANAGTAFLGIFILIMNAWILQTNEEKASNIQFVYEQFKQGQSIECGLWRGTRTIADPTKGWLLEKGRFVKDDTVLNDPSLCSVVGKEFPEIYGFIPLIFFLCITGLSLLARLGIRAREGRDYWSGEKKSSVHETDDSDELK